MQINAEGLKLEISGQSLSKDTILLSPRSLLDTRCRLLVLSHDGKLLKSQVAEKGFCADFRQIITPAGNTFYTYNNGLGRYKYGNGWYENVEIKLLDENLQLLPNKFNCIPNGSVEETDFPQCHDNLIIDETHYYLLINKNQTITYNGCQIKVINNIIQEIKNNQVIWQFETINHPELMAHSIFHVEALKFNFADYAHINSIAVENDNYIWVSFRNIGVAKIAKDTNRILWICGEKPFNVTIPKNFTGFKFQHDIRVFKNELDTFSCFDNVNSRAIKAKIENNKLQVINEVYGRVSKNSAMGGCIFGDNFVDICSGMHIPGRTLDYAENFMIEYNLQNDKPEMRIKFLNTDNKLVILYRMARGKI